MEIGFLDFFEYDKMLSSNRVIQSYTFLPGIKSSKKQVEKFENCLGTILQPFLKEYVSKKLPLSKIQWSDDYLQRGSAYFPSLKGMLLGSPFTETKKKNGEKHKNLLWTGYEDPALIKELEDEYLIFDIISMPASVFTLIKFDGGKEKLVLYTYPSFMFPLNISVEQYIVQTSDKVATFLWQENFIEKKKCIAESLESLNSWREKGREITLNQKSKNENNYSFVDLGISHGFRDKLEHSVIRLTESINKRGGYLECGHPFITNKDKLLNILTIRKVEQVIGWRLPEDFLSFYSQINGLKLDWRYEGQKFGGRYPSANLRVLSFEEVFGGFDYQSNRSWNDTTHEGLVTMHGVMDDDVFEFAKNCRPIVTAEGVSVVIRLIPDMLELYILASGNFYKLETSFIEFMKVLISVVGMDHFMMLHKWNTQMGRENLMRYNPIKSQVKHLFKEFSDDFQEIESNLN